MKWERHTGGEMPCPAEQEIYFGIRARTKFLGMPPIPIAAGKLRWEHGGNAGDIIWWSPA